MFHRIIKPLNTISYFIFGARGTGKSTFIRQQWQHEHHYINLLLDKWERRYTASPDLLISDLEALHPKPTWVVIDEIQKVPKLLDIVHELIQSTPLKFVLTGSSARKLKKSSANLLAGRALHYKMYPLTVEELGDAFDLEQVLNWGSLPAVISMSEPEKSEYLSSYCHTYLREEILQEQIVRNGVAFRNFLEVAAQENGKTINFSKLARDLGVDTKTAQSFFQILEDTLIGQLVSPYTRSTRKSVKLQPKFYLFDLGVKKAMELGLEERLKPKTGAYGYAFEHFMFLEIERLNSYKKKNYKISHYQTTAGGEIDFILHNKNNIMAIEVKSTTHIDAVEVRKLARVAEALKPTAIYYVSQDKTPTIIEGVHCLHWVDFLKKVF